MPVRKRFASNVEEKGTLYILAALAVRKTPRSAANWPRGRGAETRYSAIVRPVLDFILDHAQNDERPYLRVDILGVSLLDLLDSGASRTILKKSGWKRMKRLNLPLDDSKRLSCVVANGERCGSIGPYLYVFVIDLN